MRRRTFIVIITILALLNLFTIKAQYVIQVERGKYESGAYLELATGQFIALKPGEHFAIQSQSPGILIVKGMDIGGWTKFPVYPEPEITFELRELDPAEPEPMFYALALIQSTGKRNKILLFAPELRERTYPGRPPIYYLSSVLRQKRFEARTIDVDIAGRKKFLRALQQFNPDVIGGSALSIQINETMELMELAKGVCPHAITVLGGNHATSAGEYLYPIHAEYLDAVVVGEGLTTIELIARAVMEHRWDSARTDIPGLLQWDGLKIIRNKPAAIEDPNRYQPDLPYRAAYNFSIFNREDGTPRKTFQCMTAFGCMNACFFCYSSTNLRGESQRVERRMSIKTAEEFLWYASRRGYEAVYFDDDTFTRDRKHAVELSRLCKKYGLVFGCHTRPDCEDEALIREFAANGCRYMFSGFETAVPEILRGANKTHDPEEYRNAYLRSYHLKNKVGIPVSAFMIHGMPRLENESGKLLYGYDTVHDSRASIEFAVRELDPTYLSMNVLRFLPDVPFSFASQFEFMRPVAGPLHGGYWDQKWLRVNSKNDPRCFHPILRAFEGSGSAIPNHMTPERCYKILEIAVATINCKNSEPGRNQTRIVVDPWFERFLKATWSGGILAYELIPFHLIDIKSKAKTA